MRQRERLSRCVRSVLVWMRAAYPLKTRVRRFRRRISAACLTAFTGGIRRGPTMDRAMVWGLQLCAALWMTRPPYRCGNIEGGVRFWFELELADLDDTDDSSGDMLEEGI